MEAPPKGSEPESPVRLGKGVSVETLESVINSIADPIFVKDRQHKWVILNDAYCSFMGYPREELIGKSDYDFFPKSEADVFWEKDEVVFTGGLENINEESFTDSKGVLHIIVTKKALYRAPDGGKFIVGVIRDITEHKKTDEELHRHREHLEELVKERTVELTQITGRLQQDMKERERAEDVLYKKAKMLEALYEIIMSSRQADNLLHFLVSVLRSTVTILDFDGGGIYLVNREKGEAQVVCDYELPQEFLNEIRKVRLDDEPYKKIFLHGVPIISDHYEQLAPQRSEKYGFKSIASIPIISKNHVVGALNITSKKRFIISEDEKTVLLTICQELGTIIEKMRSEEALRESEERYRLLSESSQDFIFVIGKDGAVKYVNAAAAKQFRHNPQELIGKPLRNLFPPDVLERQESMLANVFENGQPLSIESSSRFPSHELWLDTWLIPLKDKDGKVSSVLGVSRDLTERRNMMNTLKESEEKYRQLVEMSPIGVAVHSEGKIVFANTAGARLMGAKNPEELSGRNLMGFVHPDYHPTVKDRVKKMKAGQTMPPIEEKFIRADGNVVDVEVAAMPLTFNGKPSVQVVFRDITDRKKAQEAMTKSERLFRALFEGSGVGGALIALDGRFMEVNPALCRILGYPQGELKQKTFLNVTRPDDFEISNEVFRDLVSGKYSSKTFEKRYISKGGDIIWALVSASALRDTDKGEPQYFITQVQDITASKKAEIGLRESEEKYRHIVENSMDGIGIAQNGIITYVNEAYCRIFGYTLKELIGKSLLEVVAPGDRQLIRERALSRIKGKKVPNRYLFNGLNRNGELLKIEVASSMAFTYQNKPTIIAVLRDITRQKDAEEALRESEERFRKAFEEGPIGIALSDPKNFRFVKVNNVFSKMLGYTKKELNQLTFKDITHPDYMRKDSENVRKLAKGVLSVYGTVKRYLRKDGVAIWASATVSTIRNKQDKLIYFLAMVDDITPKKLAEERLQESEKRYRGLVESQKDLVVRVDSEGRFTFVNDAYCRKFGKKRTELLGTRFQPLVYAADIKPTLDAMKGLEVPPYRIYVEQRAYTTEGLRWIGWEDYAIRDENGTTIEIQGVGRDIHESKLAEMEIAEIKSHLETILDGISESIVVLDRKYNIVSYNSAFMKWVGEPEEELKGLTCHSVIHGQDKSCRKCVIRDVFKRAKPAESIHYHQTPKGRIYHETRAYPITHNGEIVEAIYVFRDVTDRERMKEQLRENYEQLVRANEELLKLDRMKTEFLSIASHELRTPLAIIKGYTDILTSGALGKFNADQKNKMDRISNNVEHLNILVNNILDLTKMDAGELKLVRTRFSVGKLIEEVQGDMAQLAQKKKIKLTSKIRSKSLLFADRNRISQVLVNLIDNSLKFTPEGGRLTISAIEKKGMLTVTVFDTGIGIKKQEQENIFRRFYQVDSSIQRKYKGSGLGLAICKRIVELHGGKIRVKSVFKKGTKMVVTIPMVA
jgi:PAS domain S-box-containing protein